MSYEATAVGVEEDLLSAVVNSGEMVTVIEARVTEDFFSDDQTLAIWRWMNEFWKRYGKSPDRRSVRANFPSWRPETTPEPIAYYIDQIRTLRKHDLAEEGIVAATEALNSDDVDGAIKSLASASMQAYAQAAPSTHHDLTNDEEIARRIAMWEEIARNPGRMRGMSTGFSLIDEATKGIADEQLFYIIGPQKSYKSFLLMAMGIHMNTEHNARVLLINFEMSDFEVNARHDGMRAKIPYGHLSSGNLTPKHFRRLRNLAEDLADYESFKLVTDVTATSTVSGVHAQIELVKPDVVLIDGIYLMVDENKETDPNRALTNISRGIKRVTQATRVPIIATTQALASKMVKGRLTGNSAGYTSAFQQDCDVMIGVMHKPDTASTAILSVLNNRGGEQDRHTELTMDWDTTQFIEHEPLEVDDADASSGLF